MRKVEVLPFDPVWIHRFESEAAVLRRLLGENCIAIHHIGSTAVPDLAAKPIIDLLPVVRDLEEVDRLIGAFESIGYKAKGENGLPGRRYFQKGGDDRTHHVHIYEAGSPEIRRHLVFRDYLRTHPDEAEAYGRLKTDLASKFPYDIGSYISGKEKFVAALESKALLMTEREDIRGPELY
ncbi:GrpB family protein [Indiicoccus explosivorum]|uniref:GrpB family protein n=1 Tax=Indiicoccus explosivorum TaxID=1917864 RepID=UPI000B4464D6|nr:GrpB family protein [Indiicoccus explosivorum]